MRTFGRLVIIILSISQVCPFFPLRYFHTIEPGQIAGDKEVGVSGEAMVFKD